MAINTPGLPLSWRSPGTYISNVPAGGGGQVGLQPTMLIGQMLSGGTATPDQPIHVFAQSDCNALFGSESMLSAMFKAYRLNDPTGSVLCCPLADAQGSPASVVLTVSGTATASGAVALYINNIAIAMSVAVAPADSATAVASKIAAAITAAVADPNVILSCTAQSNSAVVTIIGAHNGVTAGDIQVSLNKNGEYFPSGITVAISSSVAGVLDPPLSNAITNIQTVAWSFLVCPYTSTTANAAINTLLSDTVGRWSPVQQLYGIRFAAIRGSSAPTSATALASGVALTTMLGYGNTVGNNKHMTTLGIADSQTPAYCAAAMFGGLAAMTARSNPALPIVGELQGLDAPSLTNRLTRAQENIMLYTGVSPLRVDLSGNATLPRAVQEYQADGTNYLNVETDLLVEYTDTYIRSDLEVTYRQCSLLADGNPVAAGSGATTPSLILSHVWCLYLNLQEMGIVQNAKTFIQTSYAEANISAGVVSLFLPVQTAGQLRILRILNSFS